MGALDRIENVIKKIEVNKDGNQVVLQVEMAKLPDKDGSARKFRTAHAIEYLSERGYDVYSCVEDAGLLSNFAPFKQKGTWRFNLTESVRQPPLQSKKKAKKTTSEEG